MAMAMLHRLPLPPPEKPANITKPLEDQRAVPGEDAILSCELSRAGAPVRWLKEGKPIRKSQKYDLLSEGTRAVLVVRTASIKDSGEYTCETEVSKSTASLRVEGNPMRDSEAALMASLPQHGMGPLPQGLRCAAPGGKGGSPEGRGSTQSLMLHGQAKG